MSRNNFTKWSRAPVNYDDADDHYRPQDLRYRIEEGRKAKEQKNITQLKSNVTAVPPKNDDKYSKISHHNSKQYASSSSNNKNYNNKNYNPSSSNKHEIESINKKHNLNDSSSLSKLSKKARLEAETSEIISDGSNDELDDNDYYKKKDENNSENDDKKSKSSKKDSNSDESEGELDDLDEDDEDENDNKRSINSDKSEKNKSLEDISSDGTLDEDQSQNSQYKSDNDTDNDKEKHTDDNDESDNGDAKIKSHHKHKHSRRKKSKKNSKKHSKKHHKHRSERSASKDEEEEEQEEEIDGDDNNDVEIEPIDNNDKDEKEENTVNNTTNDYDHEDEQKRNNENSTSVNIEKTPPPEEMSIIERYNCAIEGCRSVEEFECLNRIEEGTYGVVYRAKDKKTNEYVALKRLKMEKEREGFPITSLREIDTLLKAQHPNIVTVREIVVGSNMDKIYLVMDYVEHDLKSLMNSMQKQFLISEVKTLMIQLLRGISHLHDNWIIHRDLKTSNLLLSHKGVLKIADFGLAREYGSPLKEYTPIVVTLWYRSVELLLGVKKYSTAIDIWSVGCIFGELLLGKALFQGKNEKDQLDKIFKDLGTPNEKIWPGYKDLPLVKKLTFADFPYNTLRSRFGSYLTNAGFELINRLLTYDPCRRITADDALKHEFFEESPSPKDPSMFPTWPAKSEGGHKKLHDNEPKAPEAAKMYEQLLHQEDGFALQMPIATGFHLK